MCDTKKYNQIYQELKELTPEDTLQLAIEADNQEGLDISNVCHMGSISKSAVLGVPFLFVKSIKVRCCGVLTS